MSRWLTVALILASCLVSAAHADNAVQLKIEPVGGIDRLFIRAPGDVTPVTLSVTATSPDRSDHRIEVILTALDASGRATGWSQQVTLHLTAHDVAASQKVEFPVHPGYVQIVATATQAKELLARAWTDLGVIPPPHEGIRPDSFFQSNTSSLKSGDDLALLVAIGMKVERAHFVPPIKVPPGDWRKLLPKNEAVPVDFTALDKQWAQTKAAGEWVLPIAGYSLEGGGIIGRTELAERLGMYGPPSDSRQFVATWAQLLRHYPEITTYEFWNEPWIFAWTWAAPPADYRALQKSWCEMALKANPKIRLIAGHSVMFVQDNIEPDPASWRGLLSGISHHPYMDAEAPNSRGGGNVRTVDDLAFAARRMHLSYAYETEGGTTYQTPADPSRGTVGPAATNNLQNTQKLVQYYVRSALAGLFAGDVQFGLGYGPDQTQANVAYAVMTHFLEDRPVVADIWPRNELLWGGVFANPKYVTDSIKALPRANELSARWNVPVPAEDATKVAVIWSLTGSSSQTLDPDARLSLLHPKDFHAFDMFGSEIHANGPVLELKIGPNPIYVTSDTLSAVELRDRISAAKITQITQLNMYALSLQDDAANPSQKLIVRVENQGNEAVTGKLRLGIGEDMEHQTSSPLQIEPGQLVEIALPWMGAKSTETNQYPITLTADIDDASPVVTHQLVSVARFAHKTIDVNGPLEQWQGVTPVLLDSRQLRQGFDLSRYLLNPHLDQPTGTPADQRIVARIYTAYDDANVYLAAAVNEAGLHCTAGQPFMAGREKKIAFPYRIGMPDGLEYITYAGDAFQFAFGFRDRVPGMGRQMNDPWAWKGAIYDTDYCYVAHVSTDGDQLIRLWGADGVRRNGYQADVVPGQGPVPGGRIHITRDEAKKLTLYQIAVPRKELSLFDPSAGRCRFGFILYNDEKLGAHGLSWMEAAGVFDHWYNADSFPPTWELQRACQTFFSIEH